MKERKRLFLGIAPAADALQELKARQQTIRTSALFEAHYRTCRWLRPESLHLTLHFLGEVEVAMLARLLSGLEGLPLPPAHVQALTHFVCFPNYRNARVGALGAPAKAAQPELQSLWQLTAGLLEQLSLPVEKRAFVPHLSLVRFREGLHFKEAALSGLCEQPLAYPVESLTLFESRLTPEGARYLALAEFPLAPNPRA